MILKYCLAHNRKNLEEISNFYNDLHFLYKLGLYFFSQNIPFSRFPADSDMLVWVIFLLRGHSLGVDITLTSKRSCKIDDKATESTKWRQMSIDTWTNGTFRVKNESRNEWNQMKKVPNQIDSKNIPLGPIKPIIRYSPLKIFGTPILNFMKNLDKDHFDLEDQILKFRNGIFYFWSLEL